MLQEDQGMWKNTRQHVARSKNFVGYEATKECERQSFS